MRKNTSTAEESIKVVVQTIKIFNLNNPQNKAAFQDRNILFKKKYLSILMAKVKICRL